MFRTDARRSRVNVVFNAARSPTRSAEHWQLHQTVESASPPNSRHVYRLDVWIFTATVRRSSRCGYWAISFA